MASLTFDPPVSEKQRRAMWAAREGHSTIGIPKSVGEKFVGSGHDIEIKAEDAPVIIRKPETVHGGTVHARGAQVHPPRPRVHTTPPKAERTRPEPVKARMTPTARDRLASACDRRAARLQRAMDKDADAHSDDTPNAAGIMFVTPQGKILFLHRTKENYDDPETWDFPGGRLEEGETSVQAARRETEEETGHEPEGDLRVIDRRAKPDEPGDYVTYVNFCESEFTPELDGEHDEFEWRTLEDAPENLHPGVKQTIDHIDDLEVEHAMDSRLAIDRASVRSYDTDGHLHVAKTPISKANICPYVGEEIPGYEELGLDPKRVYKLLRHPDELAKAAPTFHGKQLLEEHEPTSADDHQGDITVGSVFNPVYEHPYLYAELVVWPQTNIDDVETGKQKQLSSAYHYVPDMTPGVYAGENYDGIMRDIVGNHVALVREGRAGADVVIGDSLEGFRMPATAANTAAPKFSKQADRVIKALREFLTSDNRLAKDVKLPTKLFTGITKKNYPQAKDGLFKGLKKELKGKLASDASLSDIHGLLDSLSPGKEEAKDNTEMSSAIPSALPLHEDDDPMHGMIREHLQGKLTPDGIEELIGKLKGAKESEDQIGPGSEEGASIEHAEAKDEDEEKGEDDKLDVPAQVAGDDPLDIPHQQAGDQPPPFKGEPMVGGKIRGEDRRAHDSKEGKRMPKTAADKKVRQGAMDAAIAEAVKRTEAATIARLNGISEAREKVRPLVGNLPVAFDSAEAIYRHVLKAKGVKDADKMPAAALLPIIDNLPKPSRNAPHLVQTAIAQDGAPAADSAVVPFEKMFPDAKRIPYTA